MAGGRPRNPNKESHSDRMRRYLKIAKGQVFNHYGWKCNCCPETTPQFLTVDHVNNDGYKDICYGKRRTGFHLYKSIINQGFPPRYQILCMNCNHGKRMNNGVCPHQSI